MTLPRSVGRWEVVRELGRGGMGRILEVRDPGADRLVALKLVDVRACGAEEVLRFQREAELMARVRHANVVRIHEVGQVDGAPFLVCEKVEGRPLDALLALDGPLAPVAAARLVRALADGLVACHAEGIVHRDLKPANVIVRADGSPVLLDFGVARDERARSLTETGELLGTPAYMAPEQAEGRRADARTDVYGLGATLFSCLSARPPFEPAGTLHGVLRRVLLDEPVWPSATTPGIPRGLEGVVRRAMTKRPEDRHADMAALRADLDRWLGSGQDRWPAGRVALLALAVAALAGAATARLGARAGAPPRPGPAPVTSDLAAPTPPASRSPAQPDEPFAARADALLRKARAERAARPSRGRRLRALTSSPQHTRAVLLPGGEVVAGLGDGRLLVWQGLAETAQEVKLPLGVAASPVNAITPFGRSTALLGTRSGALLVVDAKAVRAARLPLEDEAGPGGKVVQALAADVDRGLLAVSEWSSVPRIVDAQEAVLRTFTRGQDGRWREAGRRQLQAPAQGLALSPSPGAEVAVAFGVDATQARGLEWVTMAGAAKRSDWPLTRGYPRAVAWLTDGRLAVGTSTGELLLVDPAAEGFEGARAGGVSAHLLLAMDGDPDHRAHPQGLLFVVAAGGRLASASWDRGPEGPTGDVKVWDIARRRVLLALPAEVTAVQGVSLSPDGGLLLVSGLNGLLEVWDLDGL